MAMHNELWFPNVIWSSIIHSVDNTSMKKYAYERQKVDSGRVISNFGGWQSNDIKENESPDIDRLIKTLNQEVAEVSEQVGLHCPKLYNIWVNINPPGTYNNVHHHVGAMFSGVYYVDAAPEQGNIYFERGDNAEYHIPSNMVKKVTYFTSSRAPYAAKTGGLLIFPGWLRHGVEANRTNKDRISISFNYGE